MGKFKITLDSTKREYLDNGFLKVPARAARTGTQKYAGKELGLTGDNAVKTITVYRSADEVFNQSSLDSYNAVDITNNHPDNMVDSDNYKSTTVGTVASAGRRAGDFVEVDLIIKDKAAIKAVENGKAQLSVGYACQYDMAGGKTDDGEIYDAKQRDIVVNHVALVDAGRAGPQARVFDEESKTVKVFLSDSVSIDVADDAAAKTLQSEFAKKDKETKEVKDSLNAEIDKKQAEIDTLKSELDTAKKATSDAAINKKIEKIAQLKSDCKLLGGDKFACDGMSEIENKTAALFAAKTNLELKGKSEAYVSAAFDIALNAAKEQRDTASKQRKQVAEDAAKEPEKEKENLSPEQKLKAQLKDAWKGGNK